MANPFGQNAHRKGYFRKPADFYSYHFLTSISSQNKHITYKQNPLLATKLFWLLSCLISSLSIDHIQISEQEGLSNTPCKSLQLNFLGHCLYFCPDFLGKPTHVTYTKGTCSASPSRSTYSLDIPGFTIFPPSTEDPIHWPELSRLKLGDELGPKTDPFILHHSAFLVFQPVVDKFTYSCSYAFIHWVSLLFWRTSPQKLRHDTTNLNLRNYRKSDYWSIKFGEHKRADEKKWIQKSSKER